MITSSRAFPISLSVELAESWGEGGTSHRGAIVAIGEFGKVTIFESEPMGYVGPYEDRAVESILSEFSKNFAEEGDLS